MTMDIVSPWPVLVLTLVAFATLHLLYRYWPLALGRDRVGTIDGIRGYLAFGVFLHHTSIWYVYLRTGVWDVPPSRLYTHLGQTSVSVFFMITGFLFFAKLLDRERSIDWLRLYVSRVLRIVPLWALLTLAVMVLTRLLLSSWLDSPFQKMPRGPDLYLLLTAGVTWTLQYEWYFYFSLPVFAWLLRRQPPRVWVLAAVLLLITAGPRRLTNIHAMTFLGGMLAAGLARCPAFGQWAQTPWASGVAVVAFWGAVAGFDGAYQVRPMLLLFVAFALIANGADLFGLLRLRLAGVLGEITYSVYLLHGLLLFVTFRFVLGFERAATLTALEHWGVALLLTPILMSVAYGAFRWIETPMMRQTGPWSAALRRLRKPRLPSPG